MSFLELLVQNYDLSDIIQESIIICLLIWMAKPLRIRFSRQPRYYY